MCATVERGGFYVVGQARVGGAVDSSLTSDSVPSLTKVFQVHGCACYVDARFFAEGFSSRYGGHCDASTRLAARVRLYRSIMS